MKILWFTNTPSCYKTGMHGYNGGGWISSLEKEIRKIKNIELGICFHANGIEPFKSKKDDVTYYPISSKNYFTQIIHRILYNRNKVDSINVRRYLEVINDFKPDIINIFGSENCFGLISLHTQIPIVIHIQGILAPCITAFYPPGYNRNNLIFNSFNPIRILKNLISLKDWKHNAKREKIILKNVQHYMGRTEWDKNITNIYSPNAQYYHCNEILRDEFYSIPYSKTTTNNLTITTTISAVHYKGFDTILQAANILKKDLRMNFTWNVYGISNIKSYEKKFKIKADNCNIKICGIVDEKTLSQRIKESTVFVHPSYIDNSPNSVCEAQILGCPVIATYVGGIPNIIENKISGLLVPANDPYQVAILIKEVFLNKELANSLSENGKEIARIRHDKYTIISNILSIYNQILEKTNG